MKKILSGFISILLCLMLVWTLCPSAVSAEEDEDFLASWGDQSDGAFLAVSDDVDLGDVYRSCPYVIRKLAFYWSPDGDPANRDQNVTVSAAASEDSLFRFETEGNKLTVMPDPDRLPGIGEYTEYVTVYLSIGDYETAERRQEIELDVTMNVADGDPVFEINNADELMWFASLVENGYTGISAVLCSDIVLNEDLIRADGSLTDDTDRLNLWTPIGSTKDTAFRGEFDGDGFTVSGIYTDPDQAYAGLFGVLEGTVKNLRVEDSWIEGTENAGAVAAWNNGEILNIAADAYVCAGNAAGGIAGRNDGEISAGFVTGTAELAEASGDAPGGDAGMAGPVCGISNGPIANVYYLSDEETDEFEGTQAMEEARFASGEVCWLLNAASDEPVFFQDLGDDGDPEPVLYETHGTVYRGYLSCEDEAPIYANNELPEERPAHTLTVHEGTAASCGESGSSTYYSCDVCGRFFADEAGTAEIEDGSWIIPAAPHVLTGHEAVNPTCTEGGSSAYYSCEVCGRFFSDAEGTAEIADGSWILPAAGHTLTAHEAHDADCGTEGNSAYWSCDVCGRFFADEAGSTEIGEGSWIIPVTAHTLTAHEAVTPTCTEGGSIAYWTCDICGRAFADEAGTAEIADGSWVLPAAGHALTGYEAVAPTCTEGGSSAYWYCGVCGKYFGDAAGTAEIADGSWVLPAAGHTLTAHEAHEATCAAEGNSAYWSCDACGKYFSDEKGSHEIAEGSWVIPVSAHKLTAHEAVTPTCTEGGSSAYFSCDTCGRFFSDEAGTAEIADLSWVLPAAGHTLTAHEAKAPTCTEGGSSAYWSCSVCGAFFGDEAGTAEIEKGSWVLPAAGHTLTAHEEVKPTCAAEGNSAYWSCDACGKYFSDKEGTKEIKEGSWILEKTAHALTAHEAVTPTCTEGGSSAYWSCDTCGRFFSDAAGTMEIADLSWVLPAAGHTLTAHAAKAPTCTEGGSSAYWSCSACGAFFGDEAGTAAIEKGSWVLPAAGHTLTAHEEVEPTCAAEGNSAYWSCDACGKFFSDSEGTKEVKDGSWILEKTAHTLTAHEEVKPTCTENGSSAYWSCDVCGRFFSDAAGTTEIADLSWVLPAAGHTLTAHEGKAPTCESEGSSAYWSCDVCGRFFSDEAGTAEIADGGWVLPAAGHILEAHGAVAPTCAAEGSNAYWSCGVCGKFFSDEMGTDEIEKDSWILEKTAHTLTAHAAVEAACETEGNSAYWSCEACGRFFSDEAGKEEIEENSWIIPAAGHTLTAHEAKEPSCTEEGNSAYWSCDVCGKFFSDEAGTEEITEGSWVLPAAGHTLTAHEAVEAACEEEGNSAYWSCETCGKFFSDEAGTAEIEKDSWILEKKGHTLTAHEAAEPSCTEEGSQAYWSCEACGKFFEDEEGTKEIEDGSWVLPAAGHKLTEHEATIQTCTEGGSIAYWSCEVCGKYFKDEEGNEEIEDGSWNLPPSPHTLTAHEAAEPTCTENGSIACYSCEVCGKLFEDEECTKEIEAESWEIPALGHTLTAHEEKEATCTEDGSSAYWSCETCGKFFEDEECTKEIEEDSWIIPAAGHKLTAHEEKEATCTEDGSSAYWSCETCGKFFEDEECTKEIKEDSWIRKALGHDFVNGTCTRCGEKEAEEAESEPTVAPTEPTVVPTSETVPTQPTQKEPETVPVTVPTKDETKPTAPTEYMISLSDDGHGTASASPAFASTGVTVTLTAKPKDGYRFKEWQVLSGGVKISGNKFVVGSDNVEIKALFEKIPAAPPSIIGGNNSIWTEGSNTGVTMTCDGDYFSFTDLKVDGSVVAKKNYTVSAGSVILELKPEYLNTLDEGEHKVTFVFGKIESDEGRFTIRTKSVNPVRRVNVILWIIIAAASLGLIASIIILLSGRKKVSQEADTTDNNDTMI